MGQISQTYYVRTFQLFELQGNTLCYSANSTSLVNHVMLTKVLRELENFQNRHVEGEYLTTIINREGLDLSGTLNYLITELRLLIEVKSQSSFVDNLYIYSNDNEGITELRDELGSLAPFHDVRVGLQSEFVPATPNSLVVFFQTKYDPSYVNLLYEMSGDHHSTYFIVAYVLHDTFIIDPLFAPHLGTPCHFCQISWWERLSLEKTNTAKASWFRFYQLASRNEFRFPPSMPLTPLERSTCLFYLKHRVRQILGTDAEINTDYVTAMAFEFRIPTGMFNQDYVPISMTCNCIKGNQ